MGLDVEVEDSRSVADVEAPAWRVSCFKNGSLVELHSTNSFPFVTSPIP
jgi:hypothetical protein